MAAGAGECPHLDSVERPPADGVDLTGICQFENCPGSSRGTVTTFTCLICYKAFCFTDPIEHILQHSTATGHMIIMCNDTQLVWCCACKEVVHYKDQNKIRRAFDDALQNILEQTVHLESVVDYNIELTK